MVVQYIKNEDYYSCFIFKENGVDKCLVYIKIEYFAGLNEENENRNLLKPIVYDFDYSSFIQAESFDERYIGYMKYDDIIKYATDNGINYITEYRSDKVYKICKNQNGVSLVLAKER